ncbi:MAG: hypothetical protein Q7J32_02265 [Sphingomonadaceae bacterium]|nr:hypothetical protein [Sphingomonadaceae bacterium]
MRTLILTALLLAGCAPRTTVTPQDQFFDRLSALCGKAFAGQVVTTDPADADFAGKPLVMHVRSCTPTELRIPFHVGDDRSRTWVITRQPAGLRLKHDHRHRDGSEDAVTQYGGDTAAVGTAARQEFPVDDVSKAMFTREGRSVSNTNVWAVEIEPGAAFVYELSRPNRLFRVRFDLTRPVDVPSPPWGS